MKVELVHRDDLRVPSTGSSTLDTERRTLRRLTNASVGSLAQMSTESLSETDRRRRLALAERSRGDTGDDDVLAVLAVLERLEDLEGDLRLVAAVELEVLGGNTALGSNDVDGLGVLRLGDLDVAVRELESAEVSKGARRREGEPGDVLLANELEGLDETLLTLLEETLSRNDGVLHEHGDSHGSDSSGDGSDVRSDLTSRVEVDITDETRSRLAGSVCSVTIQYEGDEGERRERNEPSMKLVPTSMTTAPGLSHAP